MAAAADPSDRRRRALLIATGTYSDPGLARLRAPAGDVDALADVLGDGSIGRFDVQELMVVPYGSDSGHSDPTRGAARIQTLELLAGELLG